MSDERFENTNASRGMNETDKLVLEIMTHKQCD